jgi:predicted lipase
MFLLVLIFVFRHSLASDIDSHLDYFRGIASKGEWLGSERPNDYNSVVLDQDDLDQYRKKSHLLYTSYCEQNENWSCRACKDGLSPIRNTSHVSEFRYGDLKAHGYVGISHDLQSVFISFQGATHLSDWLRNLNLRLVKATEIGIPDTIRVHQGYYKVYKSIRAEISNLLFAKINKYPQYRVSILGHSSGGALGSLLALDIAKGYLKNEFDVGKVELITLGQPRVGNREYALAMDNSKFLNIARIIHSTDIFPHLVPRMKRIGKCIMLNEIGLDYFHHKGEIWLDPSIEQWIICKNDYNDESPYCSNSVSWYKQTTHA